MSQRRREASLREIWNITKDVEPVRKESKSRNRILVHLEQQRRRIEEGSDRRESRDEKHRWPQANNAPEDIRANRNIPLPLNLTKK